MTLDEAMRKYILATLRYHKGNRTRAAKELAIGLRTLQRKLATYEEQGERIPPAQPGNWRGR